MCCCCILRSGRLRVPEFTVVAGALQVLRGAVWGLCHYVRGELQQQSEAFNNLQSSYYAHDGMESALFYACH